MISYRLGRCQSIEDVYIVGELEPGKIFCSPAAELEAENLEIRADVGLAMEREFFDDQSFMICYHNVQSLRAHFEDLMMQPDILNCNIIGLGETWLHPGENAELPNFSAKFLNAGRGKGLACYLKHGTSSEETTEVIDENYTLLKMKLGSVIIILCYVSKEVVWSKFTKDVQILIGQSESPTLIIGDMNFDTEESNVFSKFMASSKFVQLVKNPTHDRGSVLDHVYANQPAEELEVSVKQKAVVYSDHDVIFVKLNLK